MEAGNGPARTETPPVPTPPGAQGVAGAPREVDVALHLCAQRHEAAPERAAGAHRPGATEEKRPWSAAPPPCSPWVVCAFVVASGALLVLYGLGLEALPVLDALLGIAPAGPVAAGPRPW